MNNNFFKLLKQAIKADNPEQKFLMFESINEKFQKRDLQFEKEDSVEIFTTPSYKSFCTIVDPKEVPNRKNLQSIQGQQTLLHAIAHIEYNAVDLALDACYRFQQMPKEFYKDWLEVASDEIRHFKMVCFELEKLNTHYGQLPVHQGLFDASMKTLELIPRMALIPRYMEANGLDANATLIEKLKKLKNTQHLVELLQVILDEEIDHVKKGDKWYKYGCSQKENFSCDYFKIINSIYPNSFKGNKQINIEARIKAGFSKKEIEQLQAY
ncbi:MAG: ferritin-like domain-containing protein [Campylobacterales bacterium]|nr:ferritin-like domain-containing protein [Campylobacterales bacterium]